MPKYYPINEEAAKRAKDMNSFSDYQPGSATTSYRAMVDEACLSYKFMSAPIIAYILSLYNHSCHNFS